MRTLIVVPQSNELDCLVNAFAATCGIVETPIGRVPAVQIPSLDALIAKAGHGKAQLAATTSYLLCHVPEVDVVICTGAAGSLSQNLQTGDLVISTATVEHDYYVKFIEQDLPEHICDIDCISELQNVVADRRYPFQVAFGKIASGDEDIIDNVRALELQSKTDTLCVAWEGSGAARAAHLHRKRFVEIRAITDSADKTSAADFHRNCIVALPNAARLISDWLTQFGSI